MHFYFMLVSFFFMNCSSKNKEKDNKNSIQQDSTLITSKKIVDSSKNDSLTKFIYLSFDDGPLGGTKNCLHICLENNIKASFFIVAQHSLASKSSTEMFKTLKSHYPQLLVANHSFTHANNKYHQYYTQKGMAFKDIVRAQDTLQFPFPIVRLPGNNAWALKNIKKSTKLVKPVVGLLDSAKYNVIGWDVEWDFTKKGCRPVQSFQKMAALIDTMFKKNKTMTPKHIVILMHDNMFRAPKDSVSLVSFIKKLKENPHYQFETLNNYPNLKN